MDANSGLSGSDKSETFTVETWDITLNASTRDLPTLIAKLHEIGSISKMELKGSAIHVRPKRSA